MVNTGFRFSHKVQSMDGYDKITAVQLSAEAYYDRWAHKGFSNGNWIRKAFTTKPFYNTFITYIRGLYPVFTYL